MSVSRKYRVAMVAACPFPANHGSPASIREMSEQLVAQGNDVHIVTYPIQEAIPVNGPLIHRVRMPFFNATKVKVGPSLEKFFYNPLMILKLIWVVKKYKIDVIHAHNYEGALIGWFAKKLTGVPMLYNAVNSMTDELPTYDFFTNKDFARWLAKHLDNTIPRTGDYVTTVSDQLKGFLKSVGVREDRTCVVPAGVNSDMFDGADPELVYQRHGFDKDTPIVAYTGSLDAFQRIDYLMQSMSATLKLVPEARLLMVGNIPDAGAKEKYQQQCRELGILDAVLFIDSVPLEELPAYLAATDVAVVPRPDCPGHPVKVLNYMAARKAIAGFEGGSKGLHHMRNGYLADDHDWQALGQGIAFLLQKPELRQQLAEQARNTVDDLYGWKVLCLGYETIYEMLVTGHYDSLQGQLKQYIRDSYHPQFSERREAGSEPFNGTEQRSGRDRRQQNQRIDFIERRAVHDAK